MRVSVLLFGLCVTCLASIAQSIEKDFPETFQVTVVNPLTLPRTNVLGMVTPEQIASIAPAFNTQAFIVMDGKTEIASQYNSADASLLQTGSSGIAFMLDKLAASESRRLTVRYARKGVKPRNYAKRTQAELSYKTGGTWQNREYLGGAFHNADYLRVPPEHKDHSWFIRYEGPGWESDLVGYRFYLDQRNAADVFGKKTSAMVLQDVGQDGFESYHHLQPWGMDVMKVGKSLGLGSIGAEVSGKVTRVEKTDSVDCRVLENGPVFSELLTRYHGWQIGDEKYDLTSRLSIHAGTRLTHASLEFNHARTEIVTGIVKDKNSKVWTSAGDTEHWGYIATYGPQSLNADNLGLVIFFQPAAAGGFGSDEYSEIVRLKVSDRNVQYYFGAAWAGEPGGIQNEAEFLQYIDAASRVLAAPVIVRIGPGR